jgi:glycine/D-amino acid oxidase-like deaminating enzyme
MTQNSSLPKSADYVIIGAGMHGLSTAYHLACLQPNKSIVIIDKGELNEGATSIACGVVRNNYYQPAMRKLMAHSVDVWEQHQKELHYHPVGYMQISMESMHEDVASIYEQQKAIGYESVFIEGEKDSCDYMLNLFDDWQAPNITSVLHEKRGGFSHNTLAVTGLAKMATDKGVIIVTQAEVTELEKSNTSNAISKVHTVKGAIECEQLIIAPGPWVRTFWKMLDLPDYIDLLGADGKLHNTRMWHYWMLQEGVLEVDPSMLVTNDGKVPPVLHVDSDAPLHSDSTGKLLMEEPWGIYYKPDAHFGGIQGGFAPYPLTEDLDDVSVDPYGHKSKKYLVTREFIDVWCSALAACQKRFEGLTPKYKDVPSGGLGCLTPDSFPVFDVFSENAYVIADANHGYKMLGVGKLVAEDLCGKSSDLLEPFRFSRYAEGKLHPLSNSPFPWS